MAKVGLYAISKSTTLKSNKSLGWNVVFLTSNRKGAISIPAVEGHDRNASTGGAYVALSANLTKM